MEYPDDPYLYRQDDPDAAPARPISQGDVFIDIPLAGAATLDPRHGIWKGNAKTGKKAIGLLVTHPCASRSSRTFELENTVSLAPVVKKPRNWGPPWDGYLRYFPLPGLRGDQDYVADLNAAGPVPSAALDGRRIACLNEEGIVALFHRLAMNKIRYPDVPTHFVVEAHKLMVEIDLWERWVEVRGTEAGFQEWLNEPFGGQPLEDEDGMLIPGSEEPTGGSRLTRSPPIARRFSRSWSERWGADQGRRADLGARVGRCSPISTATCPRGRLFGIGAEPESPGYRRSGALWKRGTRPAGGPSGGPTGRADDGAKSGFRSRKPVLR